MAVTLTDQRTIINQADATTSWTGSATVSLFTTQPTGVEATGCLGMVVSNATQNAYFTVASVDLSAGVLIYFWIFNRAELDTTVNGGIQIQLGDGVDRIGFHLAGSDVDGFRPANGPVGWQCIVLDTGNLPTDRTVYAGSFVNLNLAAITQIGVAFKTLVKALGNLQNCFWDISRRGAVGQGLLITTGTIGAPGTFLEIADADRSTADQRAFGVLRELGTGVFGAQAPLTFGDTAGTTATYFKDTNAAMAFEERNVTDDKYGITVQGNATGSTTFQLGEPEGTGDDLTGTDGCSLIVPTGVGGYFTATDADLQELFLYGSTLSGFTKGITLSSDATNGPNHEVAGCAISASGVFAPGRAFVRNCRIARAILPTATDAALLWNANIDIARCQFTMGASGHGIKITAPGTYDFDDLTFSGYGGTAGSNPTASSGSTDAAVYNDSGGAVTINVNGGNSPSVRNGAGATTTVVAVAVTVSLTTQLASGTPVQSANVLLKAATGGPLPFEVVVTITNSGTTATVTHTAHAMETGDKVLIKGASHAANNGVFSVTFISANSYSYVMGSAPGSNPTGTILATFVVLSGLTDVNGLISVGRVYPSNQPVIGWARKSSAPPYYKQAPVAGTVASATNTQFTTLLTPDE